MSPRCSICSHDDRESIDEAIVAGRTYRDIARQWDVSKDAVARHKSHVSHALSRVVAQREEAGARSALDRLEDLHARATTFLDAAEAEGKASMGLAAIRELRGLVEMIAKITGELDERPNVQVLNVSTAPEWLAIRAALVEVLAPYPEAAAAVAARLDSLPALEAGGRR